MNNKILQKSIILTIIIESGYTYLLFVCNSLLFIINARVLSSIDKIILLCPIVMTLQRYKNSLLSITNARLLSNYRKILHPYAIFMILQKYENRTGEYYFVDNSKEDDRLIAENYKRIINACNLIQL